MCVCLDMGLETPTSLLFESSIAGHARCHRSRVIIIISIIIMIIMMIIIIIEMMRTDRTPTVLSRIPGA